MRSGLLSVQSDSSTTWSRSARCGSPSRGSMTIGAVQAGLFLEARMAVIPVRAGLLDREAIGECLARRDAVKTETRHAVHRRRQQDAVPVDRTRRRQRVAHAQRDGVALAPAQQRRRQLSVDDGGGAMSAAEIHRRFRRSTDRTRCPTVPPAIRPRATDAARTPRPCRRVRGPARSGDAMGKADHARLHARHIVITLDIATLPAREQAAKRQT